MNRPSKTKSLLIPLFTALAGIFAACSNSDYDFNEIDFTLGLGGDELIIPTSNTKEMFIDDFLELNDGDCVQVLDNGDYAFVQEGSEVTPAHPKVDKTEFELGVDGHFQLDLAEFISDNSSNTKKLTRADWDILKGITIKAPAQRVLSFDYKAEKPQGIVSLTSIDIDTHFTLSAKLSENLSLFVWDFDKLTWELPGYLRVDLEKTIENAIAKQLITDKNNITVEYKTVKEKVEGEEKEKNIHKTILTLKNVTAPEDLEKKGRTIDLQIYLNQIDFTKMDSEIDETELTGDDRENTLIFNGEVKLSIEKTLNIPSDIDYTSNWYIESNMESDPIQIQKVSGRFYPEIDLSNLGEIDVTSVPDFLKNDGVKIDLDNPQVFLEIDNDMDVAAEKVEATLTSRKGNDVANISVPGVRINAFSPKYQEENPDSTYRPTKIYIYEKAVDPVYAASYDNLIQTDLTDILIDHAIPDQINFGLEVQVDSSRNSNIELGKDYTIQPRYKVLIPIAFGDSARISYTDSIDNLQDDLDGIDFSDEAYLEVDAKVYNKLPMHLITEVTPLTADGKDLSKSNNVTVDVDEYIPGADEGETTEGYLKIKIGGDIKQLDKLKFTVGGQASDASDDKNGKSITGITLNKNKHSLRLDNVQVKLVGRIIYDAN